MTPSSVSLGGAQPLLRRLAVGISWPLFPTSFVANHDRLERAAELVEQGSGLIVLMNHFSLRDGLQLLRLLFGNETLRRRPTLAPVASHLAGPNVHRLAQIFGVELAPVTTIEAVEQLGLDVAPEESALAYTAQALETLRNQGSVLLAPQAGRRSWLAKPQMRPVGLLLAQARRKRLHEIALFFVGLGLHGETDYSLENAGGLNVGRRYELRLGRAFRMEEALKEAGGIKNLDDWAYDQLRELVPPIYQKPPGAAVSDSLSAIV